METDYIEVLDPTGDTAQLDLKPSGHHGGIDNKIIGLLDNGKPNFDVFLTRVEELLREGHEPAGIITVRKGDNATSKPLEKADLERLIQECDVILNGICD
jgi:hypothetical protein